MLVFFKERLVLLSVPKTGTTAYQTALRARADIVVSDPPELKHAPIYRYDRFFRPIFEKMFGVEMEIMAVVRDPVDWLGSWYRYRQRPFLRGRPKATHDISFDEFVLAYLRGKRPTFANVGSQARFLTPRPGGAPARHVFRYENQDGIRSFLEERLQTDIYLQRENVSPEMTLELSKDVEEKYRRKCPEEFELHASAR
ncbi:gamma-glutamyl kinase [Lutimaribacter marinistellae]|uniref:Gamma-glutamyl kinase n=1 Tax=Lutimaribacter marinistellae TaxID=1820329 RepID=A0ABV7TMF6_9RHOB